MKFLLYQILAIGIIWSGMAFFYSELFDSGVKIFYVVTSWLLFLIVLLFRMMYQNRKKGKDSDTIEIIDADKKKS